MKKSFCQKAGWFTGLLLINLLSLNVCANDSDSSSNSSSSSSSSDNSSTSVSTPAQSSLNSTPAPTNNAIPIDQGKFAQPRFKLSANLSEGYDDNVLTSQDKIGSGFTSFVANGFADLGNPRTLFTIGVSAGLTYYYDRPGEKLEKLASLTLNLSHKVDERFTLTLNSYTTYQVEPDYTLQVEQNRVNGQYLYTADTLTAAYQWTRRFQTVTSYQLVGIWYQDETAKVEDDYISNAFENDLRFQLLPTTTLVGSYQLSLIDYLYGTGRNSVSHVITVGFDHAFSPKFTVTLRGGGQIQTQEDTSGASTSPYAEATLTYLYRRSSSIQGYLHYGFEYSNLVAAQTDKALRTGITINHSITPKLAAYLGFFYEHDNYSNVAGTSEGGYTEDTFNINTGLTYALTPRLTLQANYTYSNLLSNDDLLEYNRNVFILGATYTF